jgi:hypothetical protein
VADALPFPLFWPFKELLQRRGDWRPEGVWLPKSPVGREIELGKILGEPAGEELIEVEEDDGDEIE